MGDYDVEIQEIEIRVNPGFLPVTFRNVYVINSKNWPRPYNGDYQVIDCLGIDIREYRQKLESYGGKLNGKTTIFYNKEDAEKGIDWLRSIIICMNLTGVL